MWSYEAADAHHGPTGCSSVLSISQQADSQHFQSPTVGNSVHLRTIYCMMTSTLNLLTIPQLNTLYTAKATFPIFHQVCRQNRHSFNSGTVHISALSHLIKSDRIRTSQCNACCTGQTVNCLQNSLLEHANTNQQTLQQTLVGFVYALSAAQYLKYM